MNKILEYVFLQQLLLLLLSSSLILLQVLLRLLILPCSVCSNVVRTAPRVPLVAPSDADVVVEFVSRAPFAHDAASVAAGSSAAASAVHIAAVMVPAVAATHGVVVCPATNVFPGVAAAAAIVGCANARFVPVVDLHRPRRTP